MSKNAMKAKLLKMLKEEMLEDNCELASPADDEKPVMKAVIKADSKEGLVKGAKELPKALSKIDELIKAKMKLKK